MAISLKIKGNKRANEGVGNDLVSIGDNRFPVIDAQYPGTKGATDFIVIRHLHDKSIYTIVCKNVTPCDSNRDGRLYISVAVPVKEQVKGMFNLLIELQNAYKSNCMTYDGVKFHFMARNDVDQPFEEIIARYATEHYPYKAVMTSDDMTATAYLFMTPEQISDLLNDPMRGEFSRFGEIVLIPVADPSQYVSTINIPAKIWRSYKIFVNGRQTGQTIADPTKTVTITLPETEKNEAVSTTFSINQARETHTRGIAIDDEAQIIYLNMQPQPKPVVVTPTPEPAPVKKDSNRKKILPLILAGLCGVLVCAGIYFFVLAPSGEAKAKEEVENPTPTPNKGDDNKEANDSIKKKTDSLDNAKKNGGIDLGDIKNVVKDVINNGNINAEEKKDAKTAEEEAKERREAERKELIKQYEADVKKIANIEDLTFGQIDQIYKRRTNYTNMEGYADFNQKVTFVKEKVVNYIVKLSDKTPMAEYKEKIREIAAEAKAIGLDGLSEKLLSRIKDPSTTKSSIKNNKSF